MAALWMTSQLPLRPAAPRPVLSPISHGKDEGGSLLDPLMKNKAFQDMVRATVLHVPIVPPRVRIC